MKTLKATILQYTLERGSICGLDEETSRTSGQWQQLAAIRGKMVKQHSLTGELSQLRDAGVLETRTAKGIPSDGRWYLTVAYIDCRNVDDILKRLRDIGPGKLQRAQTRVSRLRAKLEAARAEVLALSK